MAVDAAAPHEREDHPRPIALWVVPVSGLGGVARHVLDAAEVGIPGFDLVVLTPEGPLADALRARRARIAVGKFGPEAGLQASIRTLHSAAHRLRPAVVHSHLSYADVVVAATPLPKRTVRVTTEHGIAGDDRVYHGSAVKSWIMAAVHKVRLRRFDAVIAVAEATKRAMIEKWSPSQDIRVILNGVDPVTESSPAPKPRSLNILALARLSPEKRLPQLLQAFKVVRDERSDAHLTIAGVGELDSDLKALARELGITDAVSFPGYVDADKAMDDADVLAQLSVWENCSYSLLDAANRRMRVVASAVGGNPEIVCERGLVEADNVNEVARALLDEGAITRLDGWPTVRDMVAAVSDVYSSAGARFVGPLEITIATNNGELGGGEIMLLGLARTLSVVGAKVTVVGPSKPSGLVDAARAQGTEVVELPATDRRSWMNALRRWDRIHREGLLWCNGLLPSVATFGHPGRVVHLHQLPRGIVQQLFAGLARLNANATVVPSEWMRRRTPGSQTLYNWTEDLRRVDQPRSENPVFVLGFLGRPSSAKGVDILARAVQELDRSHPGQFRLRIGGEAFFVSNEEKRLVERSLEPIRGIVERYGWVEKAEFLRGVDLLVVPSVWPETFGLIVAEAMSVGTPVIVSDAGALSEVLGRDSDVFAAGNEAALASAILRKRSLGITDGTVENRSRWELKFSPAASRVRLARLLARIARS